MGNVGRNEAVDKFAAEKFSWPGALAKSLGARVRRLNFILKKIGRHRKIKRRLENGNQYEFKGLYKRKGTSQRAIATSTLKEAN